MGKGLGHVLVDYGAAINIDDVVLRPQHELREAIHAHEALLGKDRQYNKRIHCLLSILRW